MQLIKKFVLLGTKIRALRRKGFAKGGNHGFRFLRPSVSFVFRLVRDDEGAPAVVFEDSTNPGLVPLCEAVGVYEALYNSDVSRAIAYGLDRVAEDASLGRLVPATTSPGEAIRFLENVHRACTIHASARIETR